MSTKHIYTSSDGLVLRALRGAVAMNPNLRLHEASKSLYIAQPSPDARVALIAGGGAGHEPAHASYTGRGMLTASVSGDIFASPSASQIFNAIELVLISSPRPVSILLIINNYTGDRLNFGLALARARASYPDLQIDTIVNADDVSLLHTGSLVGPRGLGGNILVCKILGAAAAAGLSFEETKKLGEAVVGQLASIGVGLEHCHIPGRLVESRASDDTTTCEIGMGLHNEPGARKGEFDSAADLVSEMLGMILQSRPGGFANIGRDVAETDAVVLFVNNLGGISQLELGAVVEEALAQLQAFGIRPRRVYASSYMTSLNAPGFSLSLLNVSAVSLAVPKTDVYQLLDAPTDALAWIGVRTGWSIAPFKDLQDVERIDEELKKLRTQSGWEEQGRDAESNSSRSASYWREADISTAQLESGIRSACSAVLDAESQLTAFDTIVGDGDCGETFAAGAKAILRAMNNGQMEVKALSPAQLVQAIGDICEQSMGGTIGALLAIFFTSLSPNVPTSASHDDRRSWHSAPTKALDALSMHTPARPGDRTIIDALRPFCDCLVSSGDLGQATQEARRGAESTRGMPARLGRATYVDVSGKSDKELPPDPGAWGIAALAEGFYRGMTGAV